MTARPVSIQLLPVLALALLAPAGALAAEVPKKGEWVSLFNGKNLDGWTPKITGYEAGDNHGNTFRVENGILKVSYDQYKEFGGHFGHLFYKDRFSHYILRVEYRFVGEQAKGGPSWAIRNSGLMFHCQSPQSMRKDQDFPVSVEAQFLGGTGKGERPTCSVCTPGTNIVMNGKLITRHCTSSRSKTYNGDQWVTAEIEVHGSGKVRHIVNGQTVIEYEKPQLDPRDKDAMKLIKDGKLLLEEGYISLQSESHPVEFRKVEIRILDK
jgi:3-keto-disaccharide hydrolase